MKKRQGHAPPVSAAVQNTDYMREMGYCPHDGSYGAWYLYASGVMLLDHVPRAEVLRALGRRDAL